MTNRSNAGERLRIVEGRVIVEDVDVFLASLTALGDEHGRLVVPLDARYVVGREHVERAVDLARRAFERGENVADDPAIELLLYAAGRRQIDDALAIGIDDGEQHLVVVVTEPIEATGSGDTDAAVAAVEEVLEPAETLGPEHVDEERVHEFFGITDAERDATDASLAELVCERVALLTVNR